MHSEEVIRAKPEACKREGHQEVIKNHRGGTFFILSERTSNHEKVTQYRPFLQ